jgi:hypothetical protein
MVYYQIQDDLQASRMCLGDQFLHILYRAIWSVNIFIVSYVIPHIYLGVFVSRKSGTVSVARVPKGGNRLCLIVLTCGESYMGHIQMTSTPIDLM